MSSRVWDQRRRARTLLFTLAVLAAGCSERRARLSEVHNPELRLDYSASEAGSPDNGPAAAVGLQLSFSEVGQRLRDACPVLDVTVTINGIPFPVTYPGGPTPECNSETGDCSGVCQPLLARGPVGVLPPGPFDLIITDASATIRFSSSNLILATAFELSTPTRSNPAAPWQVVLQASAPVHWFRAGLNLPEPRQPDAEVPWMAISWNLSNTFVGGVQTDPQHVRIDLPATFTTTLPAIMPAVHQERPRIEACEGAVTCIAESGFWPAPFWLDLPKP